MILLQVKPLKELTFTSANITATMTSRQFQVMVDVLTNLLFARLPKYVHEFVYCYQFFWNHNAIDCILLFMGGIHLCFSLLFFFFLCVFFHFYSVTVLPIYIYCWPELARILDYLISFLFLLLYQSSMNCKSLKIVTIHDIQMYILFD